MSNTRGNQQQDPVDLLYQFLLSKTEIYSDDERNDVMQGAVSRVISNGGLATAAHAFKKLDVEMAEYRGEWRRLLDAFTHAGCDEERGFCKSELDEYLFKHRGKVSMYNTLSSPAVQYAREQEELMSIKTRQENQQRDEAELDRIVSLINRP